MGGLFHSSSSSFGWGAIPSTPIHLTTSSGLRTAQTKTASAGGWGAEAVHSSDANVGTGILSRLTSFLDPEPFPATMSQPRSEPSRFRSVPIMGGGLAGSALKRAAHLGIVSSLGALFSLEDCFQNGVAYFGQQLRTKKARRHYVGPVLGRNAIRGYQDATNLPLQNVCRNSRQPALPSLTNDVTAHAPARYGSSVKTIFVPLLTLPATRSASQLVSLTQP